MIGPAVKARLQDAQKDDLFTLPTPARQDAPFREQGRSERPKIVLPISLVYFILGMVRMSPPLHVSNESLRKPRVARAQGTHRAIPPSAGELFQRPAKEWRGVLPSA
jgi:hypothetical protein